MRTTLFMGLLARRRREEWRERAAIFIVGAAHVACGGLTSTPNDASTVPDSTVAPDASDGSVLDAAQAQDSAPPACGDIDGGLFGTGMTSASDGGPLSGNAPPACSTAGATHSSLVIVDNSDCPIEVWWVDYSCKEIYYDTVAPGGMVTQNTFVTHPWRLRIAGTRQLVEEIPGAADATQRTFTYP